MINIRAPHSPALNWRIVLVFLVAFKYSKYTNMHLCRHTYIQIYKILNYNCQNASFSCPRLRNHPRFPCYFQICKYANILVYKYTNICKITNICKTINYNCRNALFSCSHLRNHPRCFLSPPQHSPLHPGIAAPLGRARNMQDYFQSKQIGWETYTWADEDEDQQCSHDSPQYNRLHCLSTLLLLEKKKPDHIFLSYGYILHPNLYFLSLDIRSWR